MCMANEPRKLLTASLFVDVARAALVALMNGAIVLVMWDQDLRVGTSDPVLRLTLAFTLTVLIALATYDVNRLRRAAHAAGGRSLLRRPSTVIAMAPFGLFFLGWAWTLFRPKLGGAHGDFTVFAYPLLFVACFPLVLLLGLLIENGWLRFLLRGERTAADVGVSSE